MNPYLFLITGLTFFLWFLFIRNVSDPRTWFKGNGKNFISALPFLFISMVLFACLFAFYSWFFSHFGRDSL